MKKKIALIVAIIMFSPCFVLAAGSYIGANTSKSHAKNYAGQYNKYSKNQLYQHKKYYLNGQNFYQTKNQTPYINKNIGGDHGTSSAYKKTTYKGQYQSKQAQLLQYQKQMLEQKKQKILQNNKF